MSGLLARRLAALALTPLLGLSACTTVEKAPYTRHLRSVDGPELCYVRLRHYGVDLFGTLPISPNTPDVLIRELAKIVEESGGTTFDLVVESQGTYWNAIPPISWIFSPTVSEVGAVYAIDSQETVDPAEPEPSGS